MGNISASHSNLLTKSYPNAQVLPKTSSNLGTSNKAVSISTVKGTQLNRASSLSPKSVVGDIKKNQGKKIGHAFSYFNKGHQNCSNKKSTNLSDISLLQITSESPSVQPPNGIAEDAYSTKQFDNSRCPGRHVTHPYTRPKTLPIRAYPSGDASSRIPPQSLDLTSTSDYDRPVFSPLTEEHTLDASEDAHAEDVVGTRGSLRSIPSGTYPLHRQRYNLANPNNRPQSRSQRLSKIGASLDSSTAVTTPMRCTLSHYPLATKAFPFLPDGTAYLLSDERHRAIEQSLRGTKLLLHRLKRLLVENTGHLHSFAEHIENHTPVNENWNLSLHPSETTDSDNSSALLPASSDEPITFEDAIREVRRLKCENANLREEIRKRDTALLQGSGFAK